MKSLIYIILFLSPFQMIAQSDTLFLRNGDTIVGSIYSENKFIVKMKNDTGWVFIQHSDIIPQYKAQTAINPSTNRAKSKPNKTRTTPSFYDIPVGEFLVVQTNRRLTTKFAKTGEIIECRIVQSIKDQNGRMIIPANTPVIGRVKYSVNGNAFRQAALELELIEIHLFGEIIPISTSDNIQIVENYTAERVLGSAAAGSIIGGIFYNEWLEGALLGAATGMAVSLIVENNNIIIPQNSTLQFMLRNSIRVNLN